MYIDSKAIDENCAKSLGKQTFGSVSVCIVGTKNIFYLSLTFYDMVCAAANIYGNPQMPQVFSNLTTAKKRIDEEMPTDIDHCFTADTLPNTFRTCVWYLMSNKQRD